MLVEKHRVKLDLSSGTPTVFKPGMPFEGQVCTFMTWGERGWESNVFLGTERKKERNNEKVLSMSAAFLVRNLFPGQSLAKPGDIVAATLRPMMQPAPFKNAALLSPVTRTKMFLKLIRSIFCSLQLLRAWQNESLYIWKTWSPQSAMLYRHNGSSRFCGGLTSELIFLEVSRLILQWCKRWNWQGSLALCNCVYIQTGTPWYVVRKWVLANERPWTTLFTREKSRSSNHKLRTAIFRYCGSGRINVSACI